MNGNGVKGEKPYCFYNTFQLHGINETKTILTSMASINVIFRESAIEPVK